MSFCLCCFCCLGTQTARCIENGIIVIDILHIPFWIWALVGIPWEYVHNSAKYLMIIPLVFLLYNFICIFAIKCFRHSGTINTSKNGLAKCLCISVVVTMILELIVFVIGEIIANRDMYDADRPARIADSFGYEVDWVISNAEWAAGYVATSFVELMILLDCYFWAALSTLIDKKTDGPYFDYVQKELEAESKMATNAYIIGNIGTVPGNLVLVGYDERGNPVYSQSNPQVVAVGSENANTRTNLEGNNIQNNQGQGNNQRPAQVQPQFKTRGNKAINNNMINNHSDSNINNQPSNMVDDN